jgi:transposase InsO family protein
MDFDPIALFRYQVIAPLVNTPRGEVRAEMNKIIGTTLTGPHGKVYRLGRATILRWLALFRTRGIEALKPRTRGDRGVSRKMDGDTAQALMALKQEKPRLTVNALIFLARKNGIISPGQHLPKVSVYRLLKRHGLMNRSTGPSVDRRRFEAEYPLDIVQADVMHGPKIKGRKAYLIAMIDDHSRLIPWAEFRPQETVEEFIAVLTQAFRRRGLPRKLYVDNGSAFRSARLAYALASLGVSLIHSTPYQPEGKGKCERWFRTVRENFLPQLSSEDFQSFDTLNLALRAWIDGYYHLTTHSSTGEAPLERFVRHLTSPRHAPQKMEEMFRNRFLRKVTKDRVVSLHGQAYETPPGTAGKSLELRFESGSPTIIEAFDGNKSLGMIRPVDTHSNAKVRRLKRGEMDIEITETKSVRTSGKVPFFTGDK